MLKIFGPVDGVNVIMFDCYHRRSYTIELEMFTEHNGVWPWAYDSIVEIVYI